MLSTKKPTNTSEDILDLRARLFGSPLLFTQTFYKIRTGRDFLLSHPIGRESHYISICRALKKVLTGEIKRLIINVPPRYGKTELIIQFVAWCLARFPDSNFLYVSYSHSLAKKQTQTIREILTIPQFKKIFGVELSSDTTAKDNFETYQGGSVYAAGAGGTITGRGAGINGCSRFGGAIIIDDIHKPSEVTSDTVRQGVNDWYYNTLQSRLNSPDTPIIFIGQRLHEDDLAANLIKTGEWETLIIPALDVVNNALHPEMHDVKMLKKMQEEMPYEFSAQYQQEPQPSGGGIFKAEWFATHEYEPEILSTFITSDTAETEKDYNDATVFSFWGIYRIKQREIETDLYGLHWIDCVELHVEPHALEEEFMDFYAQCMRHRVKPLVAAIEKKSTGVTLSSIMKKMQGLQIINIERTKASGSKTARYLQIQPYISTKRVSLPLYSKHTSMCIEHCKKITANNSHRFDDIADTMYDAVKLALIDKIIERRVAPKSDTTKTAQRIMSTAKRVAQIKENRTWM